MSAKLFLICTIPGLLIIWPVNRFLNKKENGHDHPDDDDDEFLASYNLPDFTATSLLYLLTQFVFTWVFSILTIYAIWHTFEGYITIRRKYMQQRANSITNRSVMVVGLPHSLQDDRALATYYESLNVGRVESAHVCRHVSALRDLIEERARALEKLERAYTEYYGNPSGVEGYDPERIEATFENDLAFEEHNRNANESTSLLRPQDKKRPTMRLGLWGLFGKSVDKIDHCREVFEVLDKAVQERRLSRIFATTSVGFVTFEEMSSAHISAQTVNTKETLSCETTLAPEPRDIFWNNLTLPSSEFGLRTVVVNITVFFLIFFWSGPISLFSSFLNLSALEKLIPGVSEFADANPILKDLIQGFLPTLGVSIFLTVVPKILEALSKNQGIRSHSGVARSVYDKYFTFIFVNVILVFIVVGTWAQTISKVYHNLGELALLLAGSLPKVASFFINFIILKGIGQFPLRLLLLGDVAEQVFKGWLSKTPRDYAETRAPPELHQGEVYANATLAFVIVLLYSCTNPIILGFGAIYFALGHLVYKYQLLYVFFHPFESSGLTWPMVYNRIVVALFVFQSTMLGLFMLKKAYLLSGLLTPLLIGTVWFWVYTTRKYKKTAEFIPLELLRPKELRTEIERRRSYLSDEDPSGTTGSVAIQVGENRRPRRPIEEDDYQAVPDRYTDYRQPPMTLIPGVLNCNLRHYNHPAIAGPLPTLWLPLKKGDGGKSASSDDEESRVGTQYPLSDSESDDDHYVEDHVDEALARRPFKLPTRPSDVPQTFDEGDNLVGGGQDEDLSMPPASSSRGPQGFPEGEVVREAAPSTQDGASNRSSAVDGVVDVYYHHPDRRSTLMSNRSSTSRSRTT
ncbi:hypothetical protein BGX34_009692 [Mortierella sp. NVP85]|nr:hypothetical protein BGX34_009692 [Mortierella sp. NVP85]